MELERLQWSLGPPHSSPTHHYEFCDDEQCLAYTGEILRIEREMIKTGDSEDELLAELRERREAEGHRKAGEAAQTAETGEAAEAAAADAMDVDDGL